MRNRVMTCIAAFFYYSGLVNLVRWWTQRSGRYLIILNYHRADGDLRRHLLYLRRHFRLLNLETALEELYSPSREGEKRKDRRTPLVLTFDDGYYDNYTHGFTLARELKVPLTIFLIAAYIENNNSFWWLDRLIRHARVDEATIEGRIYHLHQQEDRKALAQAIDARVSHAVSTTEREAFLLSVRKALAVTSTVLLKEEPAPLLNWREIQEMEESGLISFGAHTLHHPALGNLPKLSEVQHEVEDCRLMLEQRLGHSVRTFAYPYGKPEHIGEQGPYALQQAGYDWAVTTIPGFNTPQSDPYLLRRIFANVRQDWLIIALKTSGMWDFFSHLYDTATLLIRQHLTSILRR